MGVSLTISFGIVSDAFVLGFCGSLQSELGFEFIAEHLVDHR